MHTDRISPFLLATRSRYSRAQPVEPDHCQYTVYTVSLSSIDGELVLLRERQCPIKKLEPISSEVALQLP